MKLVPRSLFGRTALLILAVLFLSQAGAFALFRYYNADARVQQRANILVAQVMIVTDALDSFDGAERAAFAERMSNGRNLRLLKDTGAVPGRPLPPPLLRHLSTQLSARLGYVPEIRLAPGSLWVKARTLHGDYWLMLPRHEPDRGLPWQWLATGALMALLALAAAFLIVWRINRPLRDLAAAATLLGQGGKPAPLEESGPSEICALSRSFNQMATDLGRLDTDRALLLAGISHDLRTPLARLRLGIEMADDKLDPALKAGMEQDIGDIDAVVEQFLAYVREGGGEAVEQQGDLNAIAKAVGERYRKLGKQVALNLSPLPPLPLRPTSMQRLVTNLVDNALRYASEGVEIRTGVAGGSAILQVLDRGPGIPEKDFARMLQPFTRLDPSRGGKGGAGLGLAIVQRIARLHGGEVTLAARVGGGLEVRVSLPLEGSRRSRDAA